MWLSGSFALPRFALARFALPRFALPRETGRTKTAAPGKG